MRNQLRSALLLLSPRCFKSRRWIEPTAWNWEHHPVVEWDSSTFDILIHSSLKSCVDEAMYWLRLKSFEVEVSTEFWGQWKFRIRNWNFRPEVANCVLARSFELPTKLSTPNVHTSKQTTAVSCQRSANQSTRGIAMRTAVTSRHKELSRGVRHENDRLLN